MSTKIYSAITEPTQSHPERALYKQTYVNTMMALLPAFMKVAPQVSDTVAHETLVLGSGFTFAIDIDGFGRAITFEQHGSSWRVAADKEPDFVIEFRDLDYAFDVFSGAISLKEALAARLFATHGANSKSPSPTYSILCCAPSSAGEARTADNSATTTSERQRLTHLRSMCSPTPSELLRPIRTAVKENLHERF